MGQTIAEKIIARAAGVEAVRPGEYVTVSPDYTVIQELYFVRNLKTMARLGIDRLAHPDKVVAVVDHTFLDSFSLDLTGKADRYAELLHDLPAGLSEWAVHPAVRTDEAEAIDPGWRVRHSDYEFLTSANARALLDQEGITVIDYSVVQRAWST